MRHSTEHRGRDSSGTKAPAPGDKAPELAEDAGAVEGISEAKVGQHRSPVPFAPEDRVRGAERAPDEGEGRGQPQGREYQAEGADPGDEGEGSWCGRRGGQ